MNDKSMSWWINNQMYKHAINDEDKYRSIIEVYAFEAMKPVSLGNK